MNKYFGQISAAALIMCFLLPSFIAVTAQTESDKYEVSFKITFTEDQFLFDSLRGYDTISLVDGGYITEPGKPMLPIKNIHIRINILKPLYVFLSPLKLTYFKNCFNIYLFYTIYYFAICRVI